MLGGYGYSTNEGMGMRSIEWMVCSCCYCKGCKGCRGESSMDLGGVECGDVAVDVAVDVAAVDVQGCCSGIEGLMECSLGSSVGEWNG